jgi:hypothetical protein
MKIPFIGRDIWVSLSHKRPDVVYGLVNELPLNLLDRYFFISDMDNWSIREIVSEGERLIEHFDLYILYVLQTGSKNFHLISPTRLLFHEFIDILKATPCDRNFYDITVNEHKGVLRFSKKRGIEPQPLCTLVSKKWKNWRHMSSSVAQFMQMYYNMVFPRKFEHMLDGKDNLINVRKYNITRERKRGNKNCRHRFLDESGGEKG